MPIILKTLKKVTSTADMLLAMSFSDLPQGDFLLRLSGGL